MAGKPNNDELDEAIDVIERLIAFIKETEPHAKVTMQTLRTGADELAIHRDEEEE
jgi:hypothetical protein